MEITLLHDKAVISAGFLYMAIQDYSFFDYVNLTWNNGRLIISTEYL